MGASRTSWVSATATALQPTLTSRRALTSKLGMSFLSRACNVRRDGLAGRKADTAPPFNVLFEIAVTSDGQTPRAMANARGCQAAQAMISGCPVISCFRLNRDVHKQSISVMSTYPRGFWLSLPGCPKKMSPRVSRAFGWDCKSLRKMSLPVGPGNRYLKVSMIAAMSPSTSLSKVSIKADANTGCSKKRMPDRPEWNCSDASMSSFDSSCTRCPVTQRHPCKTAMPTMRCPPRVARASYVPSSEMSNADVQGDVLVEPLLADLNSDAHRPDGLPTNTTSSGCPG